MNVAGQTEIADFQNELLHTIFRHQNISGRQIPMNAWAKENFFLFEIRTRITVAILKDYGSQIKIEKF